MNDSLRLDTNIAAQSDVFRQFGHDTAIIKSLLLYMAYKQQGSLFTSVGTLDVADFAKALGFSHKRLIETHSSPAQIEKLKLQYRNDHKLLSMRLDQDASASDIKLKLFDSNIENALFRLNTEALRFEKGFTFYTDTNGTEMVVQNAETIQFLERLEIRQIKTPRGQTKYVYDYTLSNKFINNFGLYFATVNFTHFQNLRKKNLDDLYFFLVNLRNILKSKNEAQTSGVSFDRLCELSNIDFKLNPGASDTTLYIRNKKRWLKKKMDLLNVITQMGVQLTFKKSKVARYAYDPILSFRNEAQIIDLKQQRVDILLSTFCGKLLSALSLKYPTTAFTEDNAEYYIIKYFNSTSKDEELIKSTYRSSYLATFKSVNDKFFAIRHAHICDYLSKCKSLEDVRKALHA